jgi:hypothetical protein
MSNLPPQGPPAGASAAPPQWAPYGQPQGWTPPQGWGPPPGWGGNRWPAWWQTQRRPGFHWSRLPATLFVAFAIGAVVVGGVVADVAIAAPSAGTVVVGGSVTLTAASGWVRESSDDPSFSGIELRKANAVLTAEVVHSGYTGDSAALMNEQKPSLEAEVAQVSYGDPQTTTINGHDTTSTAFEATVTSGGQSGVIDGEFVCMVVDGNGVAILAAAEQGHLDPVIDDVTAMLRSVAVAR